MPALSVVERAAFRGQDDSSELQLERHSLLPFQNRKDWASPQGLGIVLRRPQTAQLGESLPPFLLEPKVCPGYVVDEAGLELGRGACPCGSDTLVRVWCRLGGGCLRRGSWARAASLLFFRAFLISTDAVAFWFWRRAPLR